MGVNSIVMAQLAAAGMASGSSGKASMAEGLRFGAAGVLPLPCQPKPELRDFGPIGAALAI